MTFYEHELTVIPCFFVFLVLHVGVGFEVLKMIEKREDRFQLVLTNVHGLESRGREIIRYINEQFKLPAICKYNILLSTSNYLKMSN